MGTAAVRHLARYRLHEGIHHGWRVPGGYARLTAAPWLGGRDAGPIDRDDQVRLLAPVVPSKIVCVGLNYRAHVAESVSVIPGAEPPAEPLLFLKPPSAVIGGGQPIRYPRGVTRMDPEAELGVVIGRRGRQIPVRDALAHVAGLTCFNDVSARNYQRRDGQWTRAKGFDTFAPLGPWVAVGLAPERLEMQRGNTADLLFPVPSLVHFISTVMTLEPGDVIATGTPAGVAPIEIGDRVEVEIEGIGVLENPVEASETP